MIDLIDYYIWKLTRIKPCKYSTAILDDVTPSPQTTTEKKVFQYWAEVRQYMRSNEAYKQGFDIGYNNYDNTIYKTSLEVFDVYLMSNGDFLIPTECQCFAFGYSEGYDKREADECTRILEGKAQVIKKTESPKNLNEVITYIRSTDDYKTGFRAGYEGFDTDKYHIALDLYCALLDSYTDYRKLGGNYWCAIGYVDGYHTRETNTKLVFNGLTVIVKKKLHPEAFDKKNFKFS
jgi:hypothetical protein